MIYALIATLAALLSLSLLANAVQYGWHKCLGGTAGERGVEGYWAGAG